MINSRLSCRFGMLLFRCMVLFLVLCSKLSQVLAQQVANEQVYVEPTMWSGVLLLQSGFMAAEAELPEVDRELLTAAVVRNAGRVVLVTDAATNAALDGSKVLLEHESKVTRLTQAKWLELLEDADTIKSWGASEAIWLDVDRARADAILNLESAAHERLVACLEGVLAKGGFVRIVGDLSWLGTDRVRKRTALLANCLIEQSRGADVIKDVAADGACIQLKLVEGLRCVLAKRQLVNLTSDQSLGVALAATEHYSAPLTQSLRVRQSIDWVQWQRALLERQRPHYPGDDRTRHVLLGGSLVIGGGGGMPQEVWKRFVELAGGENARIVILPTAVEDPSAEPGFEARVMTQVGAKRIVNLPQIVRGEVEDAAFLRELDRATGVWFGGGRQWRFVDAYWGTAAWPRLLEVCKRGGVIGGSSAGATIQGDLLVRGAPAGNQIMIADGYRRGLGLLPGVAIDQHFAQRSRFKELEGCLATYPSICGVGIDEQTALVVTGADRCEVLGVGSAWLYPSYDVSESKKADTESRAAMRQEFKSGSVFELNAD